MVTGLVLWIMFLSIIAVFLFVLAGSIFKNGEILSGLGLLFLGLVSLVCVITFVHYYALGTPANIPSLYEEKIYSIDGQILIPGRNAYLISLTDGAGKTVCVWIGTPLPSSVKFAKPVKKGDEWILLALDQTGQQSAIVPATTQRSCEKKED